MRVAFDRADFQSIKSLWSEFYPEKYHVSADLIRANTVDSRVFDWGASEIEQVDGRTAGFVAVKRSANPTLFKGPDPDQAHLSALAFAEPNVGIDLVSRAKRILRERGIHCLIFGQDSRHFFPGCPEECGSLRDFLMVEGFEVQGQMHDVESNLSNYEPPAGSLDPLGKGTVARVCETKDQYPLSEFLDREFPGRWTHDVLDKLEIEGPSTVLGLFHGERCEGFALLQSEGAILPIGGAVWHRSLGEHWGSLGPIGVSKSVRGKGLGKALLASGLIELRHRGVKRCIIDWTNLIDFYGAHGFEIARTYKVLKLEL